MKRSWHCAKTADTKRFTMSGSARTRRRGSSGSTIWPATGPMWNMKSGNEIRDDLAALQARLSVQPSGRRSPAAPAALSIPARPSLLTRPRDNGLPIRWRTRCPLVAPNGLRNVRSRQGQSGKHLLALSFSGFDPQQTLAARSTAGKNSPSFLPVNHLVEPLRCSYSAWGPRSRTAMRLWLAALPWRFFARDPHCCAGHRIIAGDAVPKSGG